MRSEQNCNGDDRWNARGLKANSFLPAVGGLLLYAMACSLWVCPQATGAPLFSEVTAQAGISYLQGPPSDPLSTPEVTAMTGGAAAGDFDGDGWVDLFVTRIDDTDILYRNLGGGQFADVSATAFGPTPINTPSNGAAWGDIDNDGDLDLYVTTVGHSQHLLYINDGNGAFSEQAISRGTAVGSAAAPTNGTGIALGDYDRDGYLDLFVAEWRPYFAPGPLQSRLLHNQGDDQPGSFVDVTEAAGVSMVLTSGQQSGASRSFSPRFSDLDGDRYPDLAITSDYGTSRLFWNEGPGAPTRFSDGTISSGANTGQNDMGSTIGDFDGDGRLDWFITDIYIDGSSNEAINGNRLFHNEGNRLFSDMTDDAGVRNGDWGWGTAMVDFDNDGDLDIVMTNGFVDGDQFLNDPMRMWENDGTGQFSEIGSAAGVDDTGQGRGLLTFDYDNDGDLDVFVSNNGGQPVLLRNDSPNNNEFLRITTVGTVSNRDGIGALITVIPDENLPDDIMVWEINAGSHFLSQSEFTAHFGLGSNTQTVDRVQILWPSGLQQVLLDVPAGSDLLVTEQGGDFNSDGSSDGTDLAMWTAGFGKSGAQVGLLDGDADGDFDTDGGDFLWWQRSYDASAAVSSAAVPEPSAILLLTIGAVLLSTMGRP